MDMNIADIASPTFEEVDINDRFGTIQSIFDRSNPKGILVTADEAYRGVLTERQILQSHVSDDTRAQALMRSAPKIDRTDGIREVSRMLVEGDTKVAPVFENDQLWGIITVDAILSDVLDNLDALTVEQIYTEDIVSVEADTTIGRSINLMREHGISRLPVRNENGLLAGILTTHDLSDVVVRDMDKPTRGDRGGDLDRMLDLPVYDAMSSPVETADVDATVKTAAEKMLDQGYSGLVATTDDDGTIAGVITKTDILRALSYTEEEHMDVQITNIDLLDSLTRVEIRKSITAVADKFQDMQVQHAHVRFHKHKEKLRGVPLIDCQIRLRTNAGQVAGSGEGYGADSGFHVALDKLERNVLEMKAVKSDEEYRGQLLRKLGEL